MPAVLSFLTAVRYSLATAGSAFFGLGRLLLLAARRRVVFAAENLFP